MLHFQKILDAWKKKKKKSITKRIRIIIKEKKRKCGKPSPFHIFILL